VLLPALTFQITRVLHVRDRGPLVRISHPDWVSNYYIVVAVNYQCRLGFICNVSIVLDYSTWAVFLKKHTIYYFSRSICTKC